MILIIVFLLDASCNTPPLVKSTNYLSNPKNEAIIEYELPDLNSSESNQSFVYYSNGLIDSSVTFIYGDIGQMKIQYYFLQDYICAVETSYWYSTSLSQINDDFYIKDSTTISYQLDYNGKIIGMDTTKVQNIFMEFKNTIPFHISSE